ncbi:hypothetical protein JBKA6_0535 [Ichthyobacterium seriolicida]|uniref:Uncharacterized protein n=1 Tax=Ichthyobacterium seriolicida TaxID=242600 RepID=A0A1J1E3D0_9FLAO|nr:hypothetical protein JBKA6_0535 [Ichthyobacterium seriolicida]
MAALSGLLTIKIISHDTENPNIVFTFFAFNLGPYALCSKF